jgi:YaiO family outer membrane protein
VTRRTPQSFLSVALAPFTFALGLAWATPHAAEADSVLASVADKRAVTWFEVAQHEAHQGRHDAALAAVDSALAESPAHFDARLLRARVLSWKRDFALADTLLRELETEHPGNAEVGLVSAYLRYYQGRFDDAATGFRGLLIANPDNQDAREGLDRVERALAAPPQLRLSPAQAPWRLDAGGDFSTFTRRNIDAWNHQYVQLGHRTAHQTHTTTVVHARLERHERFDLIDWSMEAGVLRNFHSRFWGAIAGGFTPMADFRPDWRASVEAEWLALPSATPDFTVPAIWLLGTGRYDTYADAEFFGFMPGARLQWSGAWAVTGKVSHVVEVGGPSVSGWSVRADGETHSPSMGPLHENIRFWLGAANAPETIQTGGQTNTVSTFTLFTGFAVDTRADIAVVVGYARDDRQNSWVRHVVNLGITRVF